MSVIFVDNRERLDALLRTLGEQTGPLASRLGSGAVERLALKHVVAIGKDVVNSETRKLCELKGLNLYSFDDLLVCELVIQKYNILYCILETTLG